MSIAKTPANRRFRVVLEEHDMTHRELAHAAKLHPGTISRVFNGRQTLSAATAARVASILGSTPSALGLVKAEARCE